MIKKLQILIIFLIGFFSINAQIFDATQQEEIKKHTIVLLNRYVEYADLTYDGKTITESYKTEFNKLFLDSNKTQIYNTLFGKEEHITPVNYIEKITANYPHGVEVKLEADSLILEAFSMIGSNKYSVIFKTRQFTVGINNNDKITKSDIIAIFTVNFVYDGVDFSDFKISKITSQQFVTNEQSDEQMKGFYLGAELNIGFGRFNFSDFDNLLNRSNLITPSTLLGLSFSYFINSNIGIISGVE